MEADELVEIIAKEIYIDISSPIKDAILWDELHTSIKQSWVRCAETILSRLDALGLVVMPKTATDEMIDAAESVKADRAEYDEDGKTILIEVASHIYTAMVSAGAIRLPSPSEEK